MLSSVKRHSCGATLAAVLVLVLTFQAQAQPPGAMNSPLFQVNPAVLNYAQNMAFLNRAAQAQGPAAAGLGYTGGFPTASLTSNPYATSPGLDPYSATPSTPGYGGYPPYYSSYYDPYGGYFRGVGDLVGAYGKYYIDVNKARLLNQQVEQAKLDTRRRMFDEWRYEMRNMPTAEDITQQRRDLDLRVARGQPQTTDILSGRSLNDLLSHLKAMHGKNHRGTSLPLDEDLLKKVNVKTDFGGNIGLLKNGGRLVWPQPLRVQAFDELRKGFELHAENAVDRAKVDGRPVDAALITSLQNDLRGLSDLLEKNVSSMTTGQYIDARRYLNLLGDALRALQDPNVASYFTRKFEARGKTVADLVDYMRKEGLTFAPAVPGDEGAYRALQSFLAAYDDSVTRLASNR
jgi:hypothetical protein